MFIDQKILYYKEVNSFSIDYRMNTMIIIIPVVGSAWQADFKFHVARKGRKGRERKQDKQNKQTKVFPYHYL